MGELYGLSSLGGGPTFRHAGPHQHWYDNRAWWGMACIRLENQFGLRWCCSSPLSASPGSLQQVYWRCCFFT